MTRIILSSGTGSGSTAMAAFDAALCQCGMYHNNLIHLSSMIPTGSTIEEGVFVSPLSEYGERRYVVLSRADEGRPGHEAWAGLGWTQDSVGRGMFVELRGHSEQEVTHDIESTLKEMIARRDLKFDNTKSKVIGIRCEDRPVCALVMAFFPSRGLWTPIA
ncbi:hypothetical protein WT01_23405 [Burkholderia cepacia]|uniref:pyruvoyl-dependent arginine decarboxylase n=1 Tax=Burkholderia cepacia TaxID=292 RepID=UPI000755220D|nr:pyruvoyl-dependent arginine decarboxylase [Burkholderia cepacia]KVL55397.1 hypothetical protein WT01_23405 [Burkholderia cepacia]